MRLFSLWVLVLMFCTAGLASASPLVRLRYEVQPIKLEFWKPGSSQAYFESIAREVFSLVNASPLIVTILEINIGRDELCSCFLGFDSLEIVIEKFDTRVNLSYAFKNFSLVCREGHVEHFEWLTSKASEPMKKGELFFWLSDAFMFTKLLTVDPVTGDVRDAATGAPLGEWIYQLRQWELKQNSTVVLAAHQSIPIEGYEGINGIATIVYVNFSRAMDRDYVLNDGRVTVSAARTVVGTSLYSNRYATVFHSLPSGFTVEQVKRMMPPGFRFVDFDNGTYAFMCSYIYDSYDIVKEFKPWILEKVRHEYRYEGAPPWEEITGIVRYDDNAYVVTPLLSVTLVYDRVTGVLLEAAPGLPELPWLHLDHLLPPLPNYLGVSHWRILSERALVLKLVESSLHKPEVRLGGIGRVDIVIHAAVVASAALIMLLQMGRRLVRR